MNTTLWILQVLVGLAMLAAGTMKAFGDKAKLEAKMSWAKGFTLGHVRLIGSAEIFGAIGLLLPRLVGLSFLTPLAAACLAVLMAGAVWTHVRLGDRQFAPALVLGALSALIAIGRL
jgi:hypothetical protein